MRVNGNGPVHLMEPVDKEMKHWTATAAMSHVFTHTESVMDIVSVSVYIYINHIVENASIFETPQLLKRFQNFAIAKALASAVP